MRTQTRSLPSRMCAGLVVLVLGAAVGAPALQAQIPKRGGSLNVGIETDVRGFDAVKGGVLGISGEIVMRAIQEPLVDVTQKGEITPRLAVEWKQSADGKTWTIKLRRGVKFHDGSEFTAEDVAHHYNRILDPKNKSTSRTFITAIKAATAVDKHTVVFELNHPWVPFMATLGTTTMSGPIASKANVEADKQNRHPIGTGPFVFESWQGSDRITVKRNPDYWNKDSVYLDEVVFRVLPDTQTRFASVQSGQVDIIWTDRGSSILQGQKDKNLNTHVADGAGAEINLFNTRNEHLKDQRVRAALAHAWNQKALIAVSWQNTRPFAFHPYGPNVICGEAKYRHYDPKQAKQLLAEYGKPVKLEMIHTTTPRGRESGELLQQMYKAVGVELELLPVDQNTLVKRVFTKNFDISGWRIADGVDQGPQMYALLHSNSSYNLTGFSTPETDKLADEMRTAPDAELRQSLQCRIAEVFNDQAFISYRGGGRYFAFSRKRVKNLPANWRGLVDVTSVWVED